MNETYERIAAELRPALADRTSAHAIREQVSRSWEADYGPGKTSKAPADFHPRLVDVDGGDFSDLGSFTQTVEHFRRSVSAFKFEVANWCVGTKVFLVCVGIAAFIVVV